MSRQAADTVPHSGQRAGVSRRSYPHFRQRPRLARRVLRRNPIKPVARLSGYATISMNTPIRECVRLRAKRRDKAARRGLERRLARFAWLSPTGLSATTLRFAYNAIVDHSLRRAVHPAIRGTHRRLCVNPSERKPCLARARASAEARQMRRNSTLFA